MAYRGVMDRKGELFAYVYGHTLYTLDDEATGRVEGDLIVDMDGSPKWRLHGDGVYSLDGEAIGYLGQPRPEDAEL